MKIENELGRFPLNCILLFAVKFAEWGGGRLTTSVPVSASLLSLYQGAQLRHVISLGGGGLGSMIQDYTATNGVSYF